MTPRLVLDTNVLVAAGFRESSASAALLAAAQSGACVAVWNEATRREAERVLRRIPPLDWTAVAPIFGPSGHFGGALRLEDFEVVRDPSDRVFAALAHASGAALVSSDDDLLSCRGDLALRILKPTEALRGIGIRPSDQNDAD